MNPMKTIVGILTFTSVLFFSNLTDAQSVSDFLKIEGDWCGHNYMLVADFDEKGSFQWFKNGTLLEGEISNQINLAKYGTGSYVVELTTKENKKLNEEYDFTSAPGVVANFNYSYFYPAGAIKFNVVSNEKNNSVKYNWNFDDGNTSNEMNPEYFFKAEGTYFVSLTVTDENGCYNTCTQKVEWKYPD